VPVQITDESSLNVSPEWLPDSRHLLFVSNRDGARGIYVVEVGREGPVGEPRSVLSASDAHSISVSGDGRRLAYARFTLSENIRAVSIPERGLASLRDARRVTTGNQILYWPEVSSDGRALVFSSDRSGDNHDLYTIREEGGTYDVLVDYANDVVHPSWSPDGTEVVFIHRASEEGRFELNLVPVGGGAPVVLGAFSGDTQAPKWSRDALSVAFQTFGNEGADHTTIWTVSRPAIGEPWGDPVEFPDHNCYWPEWSPTDDVVMCWLVPGSRFLLLDRTGEALDTLDAGGIGITSPLDPVFSRDGSLIYFMGREEDGSGGVWSLPVTGGGPRKVIAFDDPSVNVGGRFTVGPDAIYLTVTEYESDIWVVDLIF
jgi:Tol biopolymer transport system component